MSDETPRDPRPHIYAALCLGMAVLYLVLISSVIPMFHGGTRVASYSVIAVLAAMAVGLAMRKRWGWWIGVIGSGYMLLLTVIVFALLVHGAAFLSGVYGAFGKGAASMVYLAAVVVIEAIGLLPALTMKFLMTRAGRRSFGLQPLWQRG